MQLLEFAPPAEGAGDTTHEEEEGLDLLRRMIVDSRRRVEALPQHKRDAVVRASLTLANGLGETLVVHCWSGSALLCVAKPGMTEQELRKELEHLFPPLPGCDQARIHQPMIAA